MAKTIFIVFFVTTMQLETFYGAAVPATSLSMPKECRGKGYCFRKSHMYPQNQIDTILKNTSITMNIPASSRHLTKQSFESSEDKSVYDTNYRNDCTSKDTRSPIYHIIDTSGDVRVVVQSKNLKQIFEVSECLNPGPINERSRYFSKSTVQYFDLRCEEVTIDVSFLVLTSDWKGLELAKSKDGIPVYCACRYHDNDN